MKIAFVITGLGMGGAEKIVTSLADALADKGHEVLIAYLTGAAIVVPTNPAIRLENLKVNSAWGMARAFFSLRRLLQRFQPDVVHSHLVHANILTRLLRPTLAMPRLISSAHNTNEEGRARMWAYRYTDRLADISTNVSDEAVAAFLDQKATGPGRMLTVHNGISTREFTFSPAERARVREELGVEPSTRLIIAVGRLNEQKDYPNLLQALARLDPGHPPIAVGIAGDGPLRQQLLAMTQALDLAGRVRFLGVRRDIPSLMSAADIFVLPSAWEGFGLVVAEAMACERVVVATDCGGVREVLGDAGFLVPPCQPLALALALGQALRLPDTEMASRGLLARQRVESYYSLDAAVDKWLNLYTCARLASSRQVQPS